MALPEKEEWVAALRSGAYKQGDGGLRCADSYCCLGVLADVLVKKGKGVWLETDEFDGYVLEGKTYEAYLDEDYFNYDKQSYLARLNDSGDFTFLDIAKIIEDSEDI